LAGWIAQILGAIFVQVSDRVTRVADALAPFSKLAGWICSSNPWRHFCSKLADVQVTSRGAGNLTNNTPAAQKSIHTHMGP